MGDLEKELIISDEIIKRIHDDLISNEYQNITSVSLESLAAEYVSIERVKEQYLEIQKFISIDPEAKILELGSGYGALILYLKKIKNLNAIGVEPSGDIYGCANEISKSLLNDNNVNSNCIYNSPGESMPFEDNSFDIIYSSSVIEHVNEPDKVISEVIRVLKPNGIAIMNFQNFGSWWEGHYALPLFPYGGKFVFKIIAKLLGRDPSYADSLKFLKYKDIKKWNHQHGNQIELISTGMEVWESRMDSLNFSEWGSLATLKPILTTLRKLKLISVIKFIGKVLHWETPFIYVVKKKV